MMDLWQAPCHPCPRCGTQTPSDAVDREWAERQEAIDMTYTCRQCRKLFVMRVRVDGTTPPIAAGREV